MVRRDPVGSKMAIVEDNDPDRTRVMHAVDESIRTLGKQVSFGTCEIRTQDDGRNRVLTVFPWGESQAQLQFIVSDMQKKVEALRRTSAN